MGDDDKKSSNSKSQIPNESRESQQEEKTIEMKEWELQELEKRIEGLDFKYKRALADYQNLEKRVEQDQSRFVKLATELFVQQMLQPFDHLLLAAKHLNDKGLSMVIDQFKRLFESQGLKEIEALGKPFDPATMEVVDTKDGDENMVIEVAQPGWALNGVVTRPAKVIVGKKEIEEKHNE